MKILLTRDNDKDGDTLLWYLSDELHLYMDSIGCWNVKQESMEKKSICFHMNVENKDSKTGALILKKGECLCIANIGSKKLFNAGGWE